MWFKTKRIFADTAAGTPVAPQVATIINRLSLQLTGNPGSLHQEGEAAAMILKNNRERLAKLLGVFPDEIYFTSGGTESNNLAVLGTARAYRQKTNKPGHAIILSTEHLSVINPAKQLIKDGVEVTFLGVDKDGQPNWVELKQNLRPDTFLVSIHYANNEIGTVVDLAEAEKIITKFKKDQGVKLADLTKAYPYLHSDACQAPRTLSMAEIGQSANLITLAASKSYGPKGIGVLVVKRGLELSPLNFGGGQENGLRSGTPAVPLIAGLVFALELAVQNSSAQEKHLRQLTNKFIEEVKRVIPNVVINSPEKRLANIVNLAFPGQESEFLVTKLNYHGVAASTGSACSNSSDEESHVIKAIGGNPDEAVRFSFDQSLSLSEVNQVVKVLRAVI